MKPRIIYFRYVPEFATRDEAHNWAHATGATITALYLGPTGLWRGLAVLRIGGGKADA